MCYSAACQKDFYRVEQFYNIGGEQPYLIMKNFEYIIKSFAESDLQR